MIPPSFSPYSHGYIYKKIPRDNKLNAKKISDKPLFYEWFIAFFVVN